MGTNLNAFVMAITIHFKIPFSIGLTLGVSSKQKDKRQECSWILYTFNTRKLLQCSPGGNPLYTTGLLQPVMVPITHWGHPRIRDGSENLPTKNLRSQIMELLGPAQTSEYLLSEKASWVLPNVENLLHASLPVHRQRLFNTLPAGMCNTQVCSVDCFKRILDHTRRASDPRVYCTKMSKE